MSLRSAYSRSSWLSPASDKSHFHSVLLQWVLGVETSTVVHTEHPMARPCYRGQGLMDSPSSASPSFHREGPQTVGRAQAPSAPGCPASGQPRPSISWGSPFLVTLSDLGGRVGVEASPSCSKQFTVSEHP